MHAQEVSAPLAGAYPPPPLVPEGAPPAPPVKMTLEEFLESGLEGYEYVEGELIPKMPTSLKHGKIISKLLLRLLPHVYENELGDVYPADTGFRVGERLLVPDVAFVSQARIPEDADKASPIPPDLAVEVVSPSDMSERIEAKAFAYLAAGTQMVWVLKPKSETVTVYRSRTDIKLLTRNDTLTGEDVVEGFACPVEELFA